jgi:hypothetical protein
MSMPGDDGFDETRGWDRASIAYRSRKPYVPDVGPADLRLPNEAGLVRTVAICTICAFCITVLYIGFPLYMASLVVPMGAWAPISLGAVFVGLSVALTFFSRHETRQFRALASER